MDYLELVASLLFIYSAVGLAGRNYVRALDVYPLCFSIFLAIGAYSVAFSSLHGGFLLAGYMVGLGLALFIAALLAAITHQLAGDYFSILTYLIQVGFFGLIVNSAAVTRGPMGISGIPALPLGLVGSLCVSAALFGVCWLIQKWLEKQTYYSEMLLAGRDRLQAEALGVDAMSMSFLAAAVLGTVSCLAGATLAQTLSYIEPSLFQVSESILLLAIAIFGSNMGSRGVLVGASIYVVLPEASRFIGLEPDTGGAIRQMLLSASLLWVVFYMVSGTRPVKGSAQEQQKGVAP